jgi:hypothetical protein
MLRFIGDMALHRSPEIYKQQEKQGKSTNLMLQDHFLHTLLIDKYKL